MCLGTGQGKRSGCIRGRSALEISGLGRVIVQGEAALGNQRSEVRGHLVVGDLQQVQHDLVGIHVLEQPLLLLPHLLPNAAHLVQTL